MSSQDVGRMFAAKLGLQEAVLVRTDVKFHVEVITMIAVSKSSGVSFPSHIIPTYRANLGTLNG